MFQFSIHLRTKPTIGGNGIFLETIRGHNYKVTMNKTETGKDCQKWSSGPHSLRFSYLGDHNYCRNPAANDHWADKAWCYTTEPGTEWEYCDIRDCADCDQGRGRDGADIILELHTKTNTDTNKT